MILATAPSDNIYYITPTARKYQLIPPQGRREGAWCYVAMVVMVLCCLLLSTPDNVKTILVGCRDRHHGFSTREKCPDRRSLSLVFLVSGVGVVRFVGSEKERAVTSTGRSRACSLSQCRAEPRSWPDCSSVDSVRARWELVTDRQRDRSPHYTGKLDNTSLPLLHSDN